MGHNGDTIDDLANAEGLFVKRIFNLPLPESETERVLSRETESSETALLCSNSGELPRDRDEQLKEVLQLLKNAQARKDGSFNSLAADVAIASRQVEWRGPIGESGILGYFLDRVPIARDGWTGPGAPEGELLACLKIIANSCIDRNENRAKVLEVDRFKNIVDLLQVHAGLNIILNVIHNVLVDYPPAQLRAIELGLSQALLDILISYRLLHNHDIPLDVVHAIFSELVSHEQELQICRPSTAKDIFSFVTSQQGSSTIDHEDFSNLVTTALTYASNERSHADLLAHIDVFLAAFEMTYIYADREEPEGTGTTTVLTPVQANFVQVLADLSFKPNFLGKGALCCTTHPTINTLTRWIAENDTRLGLQTAACLALGNIAKDDQTSLMLLESTQLHKTLAERLDRLLTASHDDSESLKLAHAIIGAVRHLAIPVENRGKLGQFVLSLRPLWQTTAADDEQTARQLEQQVQHAAISVTRLLLTKCGGNVLVFCHPTGRTTPDLVFGLESGVPPLLALLERAKYEPVKTEAARAILAICRFLYTNPGQPLPVPSSEHGLTAAPHTPLTKKDDPKDDFAGAIVYLLTHPRFPTLRSEALLTTALMARSTEGAFFASGILLADGVEAALKQSICGPSTASDEQTDRVSITTAIEEPRDSQQQRQQPDITQSLAGMSLTPQEPTARTNFKLQNETAMRADRENALCLVAELLRAPNGVGLSEELRDTYSRLLSVGIDLVRNTRES